MRTNGFLRTPIRADQQAGLQNLRVSEQPCAGNPQPDDPYPQTLLITFDAPAGSAGLQIAPLWEGALYFIADATAGLPQKPAEAVEANLPQWPLVGDLVLVTPQGLEEAFKTHIPLVSPVPAAVRYSKVRLTREFLFTTLKRLQQFAFTFQGKVATSAKHAECLVGFLQGKTGVVCQVHATDASKDAALMDMPVIHASASGPLTLAVTVASLAPEVNDPAWFQKNPDYDELAGETVVPTGLEDIQFQRFHPCHPSHSVIPARALFQTAAEAAFATGHSANTPLRTLLSAALPDNKSYRRVAVTRPPVPGVATSYPQRQFPLFQFAWQESSNVSLRLPLNGVMYLPLGDGDILAGMPDRSQDALTGLAGSQCLLSADQSTQGKKYLDFPQPVVTLRLAAGQTNAKLYAHLRDYDAKRAWKVFRDLTGADHNRRAYYGRVWNIGPLDDATATTAMLWYIRPATAANADYAPIYGFIREAACRHGLAPEFLHAVFFGEGLTSDTGLIKLNLDHIPPIRYDSDQELYSYQELGLDNLWVEVDDLIAGNYLEAGFKAKLTQMPRIQHELNDWVTPANIEGWEAAAELLAADLHWRLDLAVAYCQSRNLRVTTELQKRYVAYAHFNTGQPWEANSGQRRAETHLQQLNSKFAAWIGPRPGINSSVQFNSLIRLATSQWYEEIRAYR